MMVSSTSPSQPQKVRGSETDEELSAIKDSGAVMVILAVDANRMSRLHASRRVAEVLKKTGAKVKQKSTLNTRLVSLLYHRSLTSNSYSNSSCRF
jgi:hypothetical protein